MAVELAVAYVSIAASAKGIGDDVTKELSGPLEQAGDDGAQGFFKRFGARSSGLAANAGKALAVGIGAGLAGAAVLGKGALDAAQESAKIGKQSEAVIASTGGAAGLTAAQFGDLATSISNVTGIDDEAIQSAENLLATFTNVKNGVGDGNDVFSQATQTLVDMGAALGSDASGSAIQLGKALNDPIKGVSALAEVGVTFTEQQKAQIAAMQEAGDVAGAQKVILGELNKEFGGSAAAQATATDKMNVAVGNLQEQIGAALIPVVSKFATFVTSTLLPATERAVASFKESWPQIKAAILPTLQAVVTWVQTYWPPFAAMFLATVESIVAWVRANWPQISATISEVLATVAAVVGAAVDAITTLWQNFGDNILRFLHGAWDPMKQYVEGILEQVRGVIDVITGLIHGDWSQVWDGIKQILSGVWDQMVGSVRIAIEALKLAISIPLEVLQAAWERTWGAIRDFLGGIWDGIKTAASAGWDGLKTTVSTGVDAVVGFVEAIPTRIATALTGAWDGLVTGFKEALNKVIDMFNGFKVPSVTVGGQDPLGSFGPSIPEVTIGGWELPKIPRLAAGGIVPATTGGMLNLLGEAGRNEAVIPLDRHGVLQLPKMAATEQPRDTDALDRLGRTLVRVMDRPITVRQEGMTIEQYALERRREQLLLASTWSR